MITPAAVDQILKVLAGTKFADRAASINRLILLNRLRACEALFWRHSDPSQRLTKAGLANLRELKRLLDKPVTRRSLEYTGADAGAVKSIWEHLAGYLYLALDPNPTPGAISQKERAISPKERLIGVDLADVWRKLFGAEPTRSYDGTQQGAARNRSTPFAEFVRATLIEMGFQKPPSYSQIAQCVRDKGQRRTSRDRPRKR